jgi:hypothetical protein
VALEGGVESGPGEGALGPVPGGVFAGAEGQDVGGGFEPEGVDQVEREFVLIVLDGFAADLAVLITVHVLVAHATISASREVDL